MGGEVVGRIERLAFEIVGQHFQRSVMLPAHHAAKEILAGELAALEIERVSVAVIGGPAERRDLAGFPDITVLRVALHVTEERILALGAPCRSFSPFQAGMDAMDQFLPDQQW